MAAEAKRQASSRNAVVWVVGIVVVVGAVAVYMLSQSVGTAMATDAQPTYTVRQGPLVISVVESGTIKSQAQVALKCEVEGSATIIYLVPEGTQVKEGDLLVELDASQLQDQLIAQQISVDNAEASFIRARENLAVAKNQATSDISKAELDYQFAQEDVTQYVEGTHPQEVKEAEANITLAHEELQRAAEELAWSEKLYEKKYISQTELEADRLTKKRAELDYELAVAKLAVLEDYTAKRQLAELNSNVDQMKMALERVKLQANADIVQVEADLHASERELEQQRTKLAKYERQIKNTKIYAPRGGLAVYATSVQTGGRRMRNEPLEEGQTIRERQELIYLPSADAMMAEVLIHESSLEKVRVGLPVRITVDALPGQTFTGRVAKIALLPDAQSAWMNPDLRVFPCEIHIEGTQPELRTGMSCQAEVVVQQFPSAIFVPVQAVVRQGRQPIVFLRDGDKFDATPIELGLDNNSMAHIISGLEPGQEVLLTPPLESATDQQETQLVDMEPMEGAGATPGGVASPTGTPGGGPMPGGMPPGGMPGGMSQGQGPANMDAGSQSREAMRQRFMNMSEEEREQMRERFRNMSPEEREKLRQQFGGGRGGPPGGGHGGEGRPGGGENEGRPGPRPDEGQKPKAEPPKDAPKDDDQQEGSGA